jgi:hypothetical protein
VSAELRIATSKILSSPSLEALLLVYVGVSRLWRKKKRSASYHVVAFLRLALAHCFAFKE